MQAWNFSERVYLQFPQLLRSIALNYILRSSLNLPKALFKALNCLKKRDVIVITKPGKGSGVVVMDKTEYNRLLSATSVNNTSKFIHVDDGRSLKHYHPLLALLYGFPKTPKATLSMRPILSSTGTYNYKLAKLLEKKLKPLSINGYTITDAFDFADEIRNLSVNEDDILVSYDVTALFTNVPLDETTNSLVNKVFADD